VLAGGFQNLSYVVTLHVSWLDVVATLRKSNGAIGHQVQDHDNAGELAVRMSRFVVFGIKAKTNAPDPNRTHFSTIT
jgi:uncharacterized protein (DUF1786 family)